MQRVSRQRTSRALRRASRKQLQLLKHELSAKQHPSAALLSGGGNVLIVDHLNINHEKSRHDLATAFYSGVLGCVADPRKAENLEAGKGTLWCKHLTN